MTKVDEKAVVSPVDKAAENRLRAALDRDGVVAARLIGSQASGRAGPLSDVDLGVWVDPKLDVSARAQLANELTGAAIDALRTSELDLVVLNDAPPLLRHRELRDGRPILGRSPLDRVRLETRAILEYLDTAPLRATLAEARRRRIAEGRFGRR